MSSGAHYCDSNFNDQSFLSSHHHSFEERRVPDLQMDGNRDCKFVQSGQQSWAF